MFGGDEDAGAQDDAELGGELTSAEDIAATLGAADERLAIGGQLWLQLAGATTEDTGKLRHVTLSSPNFLDLFVDARPNDRVRAYTNARISHDWTVPEGSVDAFGEPRVPTRVVLDQLWIKADAWRRVYVTAGQQRVKWGSGRFWNPTDFLSAQRLDPLAVYDLRTGQPMLKLHAPVGAANLYAVGTLDDATTLGRVGGALRAEVLVGTTELALSAAARRQQPLRLGGDISTGVGRLDFHVEAAVQHGVEEPYWEGDWSLVPLTPPNEIDRSEDWIPQVVAGVEASFKLGDEDTLILGAEGLWNDAGTDDVDLYPWLLFQGTYTPFYVGKAYVAAYAALPAPGRWDDTNFTASWVGNLSDLSQIARLDARVTALTWLDLNAYVTGHLGQIGELRYGVDLDPIPNVDTDDVHVPAPVVDVGLGGRVRF
jgi:hypothetical protein